MENASLVKEIIIEEGITSIGFQVFSKFTETESITLPKTLEVYHPYFASGLTKLNTVNYNAVNANYEFYVEGDYSAGFRNSNVTNINIGPEVERIPNYFFQSCKMETVIVPDSVKYIGAYSFVFCNELKYIVLGNQVEEIGAVAFANTGISNVTIPESVTKIGINIFEDCTNLKTINYNAINCEYDGVSDYIYPIAVLSGGRNNVLQTINIGNRVEKIPEGMFSCLDNVTSIILPASIKTIENYAFYYNSNLNNITLNNQVEEIGALAFSKTNISSLTIPENVKKIGQNAFSNCTKLVEVNYNAINCEYIAIYGNTIYPIFSGDTTLSKITIGDKVEKIPEGAFALLSSVESIKLPDSVKEIKPFAFYKSQSIRYLDLGNGVEDIKEQAFYGIAITEITLPESLKSIAAWAFVACDNINTLYYNAIDCSTEYIFANGFCYYPFQPTDNTKNNNIENIYIGNKVKRIDQDIFRKCNITTVTIPSNVEYISPQTDTIDGAFHNCTNLKEIIVKKSENSIAGAPWSNVSGITVRWEP